jgi:hypothetical protein
MPRNGVIDHEAFIVGLPYTDAAPWTRAPAATAAWVLRCVVMADIFVSSLGLVDVNILNGQGTMTIPGRQPNFAQRSDQGKHRGPEARTGGADPKISPAEVPRRSSD